jgi:hypothetical protein
MGCLGVHFALTEDEAKKLKSFRNDADRLNYLQEELEDSYFSDHPDLMAESDKAWDAIHRSLTNGKLTYDRNGPLSLVVLGGEPLYYETNYIMSLKTPAEVESVASAIDNVTKEKLRAGYDRILDKDYGFPKSNEDFDYTWEWFQGVAEPYKKAAEAKRYVLFSASQ